MSSESQHVYPTTDEHITEGLDCWCSPSYMLPCDECGELDSLARLAEDHGCDRLHADANDMHADVPSCWKCVEGLIALTRAQAETVGEPLVIVHNR